MMAPLPSLFAVLAAVSLSAAADVRGVDPAVADKYLPSKDGTFACLSGGAVIPFSAVNDDYCDCPDGSDEPGTSACEGRPAAWFYCKNEGHIPGKIRSGRVHDGLCDPECCDGSDEAPGVCPDRCSTIAVEYKARIEREAKTRRTGAKIRSTYVSAALKERKRLEDELVTKRAQMGELERKLESARDALTNAESRNRDEIERRKMSPMYITLEGHRRAVLDLRQQLARTKEDLQTVLAVLEELSKGYNPNYQDMSVKAAVVGYRELIGAVEESEGGAAEGQAASAGAEASKTVEPKLKSYKEVEGEVDDATVENLVAGDLEALLLADDDAYGDADDDYPLLYRIEEYIPDPLYEYYDVAREAVVSWLTAMGVVKKREVADGPHVTGARDRFHAVEREVNTARTALSTTETTLSKLQGTEYGPQGEWRKLDGTCIDTVAGDYTYELCFFGEAKQKSNKDHSQNNLGHWSNWNASAPAGSYDYYTKQSYTNGAKCWNGPHRSVHVEFTCGTANAILSVTEPEKCEYRFKATSPALCWPEAMGTSAKAEPDADAQADADEADPETPAKDEL